ncbi:MAG: hypothetical protein R2784_11170 [Saprospiraceae bacterium]
MEDPFTLSFTVTDATCSVSGDGSATVTASNGTNNSYLWNDVNNTNTATLSRVNPGTYTVTLLPI